MVARRISAICYAVGRTTVGVYAVDLVGLLPIVLSSWSLGSFSTTPAFAFLCGVVTIAGTFGALMTVKGPLEMFGEPERYLEYASPFFVMVGMVFRTPKWVSQEIVHRPTPTHT